MSHHGLPCAELESRGQEGQLEEAEAGSVTYRRAGMTKYEAFKGAQGPRRVSQTCATCDATLSHALALRCPVACSFQGQRAGHLLVWGLRAWSRF